MIIDTTVSVVEDRMSKLRCLHEHVDRKSKQRMDAGTRMSMIREFLIKQGKTPKRISNYVAFWENDKLIDVQLAVHLAEDRIESTKILQGKIVGLTYWEKALDEEHIKELTDKFVGFMKYGIPNSQRNQELST